MKMKTWIALALSLMMILIVAASLAEEPRTITVSGSATVVMEADTARINLGVVTSAKEASAASSANAAEVERLMAALKEAGIEEDDIVTNYYYVNTRRNYEAYTEYGEYPIIGYEVNNSLTVIVRDLDRAGAIIDIALANGANSCDGLSFSTSQAGTAQDQALAAAIAEGKRRAAIMAEACNGELGEILSVRESYSSRGVVLTSASLKETVDYEEDSGAGTAILSDGLSFSATVEMTFALK